MDAGAEQDLAAPAPEAPPSRGRLLDRWLPLLLAAMVGCGTVYAFAAPRPGSFLTHDATLGALFADVDRGLVHRVTQEGRDVVWRPDGALTWSAARMDGVGMAGRPILGLSDVLAEAHAVNPDNPITERPTARPWRWLQLVAGLGGLGAFLLLVAGPDPRRANRWGWFWIFLLGRTSGLGRLAFLLLGAGPGRQSAEGRHAADRPRIDGPTGFGISLLAGLVLVVTSTTLHNYLVGDRTGSSSYTYDQSAGPR